MVKRAFAMCCGFPGFRTLSSYIIKSGLLCCLSILTIICKGQAIRFNHLTSENGLSNNSVLSITQDAQGFIWLGTSNGLNRYDGSQIKTYTAGTDQSGLSSNNIISLFRDSRQQLWVGSSMGLNRYNDKKDNFEKIRLPATAPVAVNCIFEDRQQRLWIGTSKGVFALTGRRRERITCFFTPGSQPLAGSVIKTIFQDQAGSIWIGSTTSLVRMWEAGGRYYYEPFYHRPADPRSLSSDNISAICEDRSNNLWIGTQSSGLNLYDPVTKTFTRFSKNNSPQGLIHNNIRTLMMQNDSSLWIGTQEGLSILDTRTRQMVSFQNQGGDPKSLSQNSIYSLYKDANGSVWIGTYFGGANRADAFTTGFSIIQNDGSSNALANNVVSSILEDRNTDLWIGTEGGGLVLYNRRTGQFRTFKNDRDDPGSIASNLVKVVYIDKPGYIWCGTHGGGLNVLDPATGKFRHYLYKPEDVESAGLEIGSLEEDDEGRFWLATNAGIRLFKKSGPELEPLPPIDEKLKQFSASKIYKDREGTIWLGGTSGLFTIRHNQLHAVNATLSVNTFFEDAAGNIWAGARNGRLVFYDKTKQTLAQFTILSGQSKNIVGILQDRHGFLWLSTDEGLVRFDPATKAVLSYTVADGLAGREFNYNSYLKDSKGVFYFGGYRGITYFFPNRIEVNRYLAPLVFTSLRLNNTDVRIGASDGLLERNISQTRQIRFNHNQNLFTIHFALLNFIKSNKNRYSYKLEGFDKAWKQVRTPSATYTNLPPGDYTFSVRGANNDGLWTQPISMKITVLPPFWRTWWAYTIYLLLLMGVLFFITRFLFLRALLKKEDELHQVKLNFFTNVSHELRTHLSLIMAPVEKLLDINRSDQFTTQQIIQIKNNSNRLLKLVSELMDFRKAESDHLKLEVKEQDLISFLQEIYSSFSELSLAKNIRIAFTHDTETALLYFDETQLEKVFFNLLANAFKFTPEGGSITVSVHQQATATEIRVADTGRGIAAAYLNKLFTNYYQVADHGMQNTGYGIGLALSKKITKLHGGHIRVESTPAENGNSGFTCFFVTLRHGKKHFETDPHVSIREQQVPPVFLNNEPPPGTATTITPLLPANRQHTVLVVEDNPELRALICQQLEPGYIVQAAADGLQGWEMAVAAIPDLIISDVMMPGLNGMELCTRLKTDSRTSHIPVILLTAKSTQADQVAGLEQGADIYITKPFSTKILELHIRNLLEARRKLQRRTIREFTLRAVPDRPQETTGIVRNKIDADFLQNVIGIIDAHLEDADFGVDKLSRKVGMSAPVLYKKLRALTNMSVNEFIKTRRFKKAAELILQKDLTINEVSYAVGYEDRKYFSREFKKYFGVAPSDFTQQTLQRHQADKTEETADD
ncbi:response regulator [Niabella sp. CC-SYL272]|uniref:hybrid sensor histidine kinase/response regulator transcription factor n=1 Tax=Niabella agricola TaxID=2891571 RepID=UPI001F48D8FB|nr:hybrid sensor histidine kinase/response regulator transcription factor [Niabella agricola]MCF3108245.1 response regulator [Niabella agricola]